MYRNNLRNIVDRMYKKISEIKLVGKQFCSDLKELFLYGSNSMDKLIYQSNGITGICSDFNVYTNSLPDKLSFVKRNAKDLENILFPKKHVDNNLSINNLNKIIEIKNKYFWKNTYQLQDIIKDEIGIYVNVDSMLKDAMKLKTTNSNYEGLSRINYDSRIAPTDMKDEIIRSYTTSSKTLKELSKELELKYGMHISVSTISVNARKYLQKQGLDFKNRREAKTYYENSLLKNR